MIPYIVGMESFSRCFLNFKGTKREFGGNKNGSCEPLKLESGDVCSQFCVSANRLAIDQYLGDSLYRFANNFAKFFLIDTGSGDVDVLIITIAVSL